MKRFAILLLAFAGMACYDPSTPPEDYRWPKTAASDSIADPIPPCTVYDLHCKNITAPSTGLQLTKCVRTSDPGCPVYSYLIVQPNEWQDTCLHVNLDGSGESWYGPCNE